MREAIIICVSQVIMPLLAVEVLVPLVVLVVSPLVVTSSSVQVGLVQDLPVEVIMRAEGAAESTATITAVSMNRRGMGVPVIMKTWAMRLREAEIGPEKEEADTKKSIETVEAVETEAVEVIAEKETDMAVAIAGDTTVRSFMSTFCSLSEISATSRTRG
jgi:hypothetical protein